MPYYIPHIIDTKLTVTVEVLVVVEEETGCVPATAMSQAAADSVCA